MPIAIALLAAAAATTPLAPSGKWTVDYREDMCVASRIFGTAPAVTTLAIQPSIVMNSTAANLLLVVPRTSDSGIRTGTATVTLQPSGVKAKVDYTSWILKGTALRSYYVPVDAAFGVAMKAASGIDFQFGATSVSLTASKFEPAVSALTVCNADLLKSWGVDVATSTEPEPVASPATWFNNDDYPGDARSGSEYGRVVVVLTVATDGKPSACRVVQSSRSKSLDDATCRIATIRGRYKPFAGPSLRATVLSVRWQLGDY